jgi:hypothetical protein
MKINHFRSLLASLTLAMVFTYSCSSDADENEKSYYAISTKGRNQSSDFYIQAYSTMESYTFLYPYVSMKPGGYFLNENAKPEFGRNFCSYYMNNLDPATRAELETAAFLFNSNAISMCDNMNGIRPYTSKNGYDLNAEEMKDWLKSENIPFYNDINSEIFVEGNSKFLGFYKVNGQEHYIFVEERE